MGQKPVQFHFRNTWKLNGKMLGRRRLVQRMNFGQVKRQWNKLIDTIHYDFYKNHFLRAPNYPDAKGKINCIAYPIYITTSNTQYITLTFRLYTVEPLFFVYHTCVCFGSSPSLENGQKEVQAAAEDKSGVCHRQYRH